MQLIRWPCFLIMTFSFRVRFCYVFQQHICKLEAVLSHFIIWMHFVGVSQSVEVVIFVNYT